MDHEPIASRLESLHTAALDARAGYEEGRKDAHGQDMAPLFEEMIRLHARNAADLAAALGRTGETPDHDGSFMSTVNETIMGVRSWFGGLDNSVIPGLIDGERRNVAKYDHVLEGADLPSETRGMLTAQRDRLNVALEHMRAEKA